MSINRDEIAEVLTQRNAVKPCHRCGHTNFEVIDGYSSFAIQDNLSGGLVIGGPAVPVVMVACSNCGAISHHALGVLGLLPPAKKG